MRKNTKRDMAYYLGVDVSTLYNWRKYKPNLYRIVMLGFKVDEMIERQKRLYDEICEIDTIISQDIQQSKDISSDSNTNNANDKHSKVGGGPKSLIKDSQ